MKRKIFISLVFVVFSNLLLLAQSSDDVVGLWYSEKDSEGLIPVVEIYKENGKYYGYFFDYKGGYNGPEKKDVKNPNKELRDLPLKGLVYLMGLSFEDGEWKGGKIYNPYDGKTYNGKMYLSEDKKTDFIKIISAMYDCRIFNTTDGRTATNKKELIKSLGQFFNVKIDDYSPLLATAKRNANFLDIFDKLKRKGEEYYNK